MQTEATPLDADLARELIAARVTTQPVEKVIAVLAASRDGTSINAAARASGINYRTAPRIVRPQRTGSASSWRSDDRATHPQRYSWIA